MRALCLTSEPTLYPPFLPSSNGEATSSSPALDLTYLVSIRVFTVVRRTLANHSRAQDIPTAARPSAVTRMFDNHHKGLFSHAEGRFIESTCPGRDAGYSSRENS